MEDRFTGLEEFCWALGETNIDSALGWSEFFIKEAERQGSKLDQSDAWNTAGNLRLNAGRHEDALLAFDRALLLLPNSDPAKQATILNNQALVHLELGDHATAIDLLLRCRSTNELLKDTSGLINAHGNLGITYAMRKDLIRSVEQLEHVVLLAEKVGDPELKAITLGNLGAIQSEMGDLPAARESLMEALAYYRIHAPDDTGLPGAMVNLGIVYQRLGELDRSDSLLRDALVYQERTGQPTELCNTYINMGGNDLIRRNYSSARVMCDKALRIADGMEVVTEQIAACQCLVEANEGLGRYREALQLHKRLMAAQDSLMNKENIEGITRLEARFEFRKVQLADSLAHAAALAQVEDERTIAQLRADKNRNRALATGGGALLLLASGGVWFYTDRRRRKERFEKEAATLETQALRSQMNPHFIFNALNSINAYVQQNDQESASSYLTKFARVMRSVLENSRHSEVPLQDDLDTLRGYMELERKRSHEKFDFTITVDPSLDPLSVLVPPLVVQPFVENAIWHGMAGKEGKGHITLSVQRQDDQLLWTIEDDGAGRHAPKTGGPENAPTKKTSLGTAITRARLDLVQKQHGGKAGFRYTDRAVGTRVEVEMPLILNT
ncbi:MAG: tetratricopeptide repeat protein [Flavobacteriales bacterium]|nr:tetratricopeptide repeat protein [Flavobacteriales bacterium]MBK9074847.1 tetratricopeptide repeat protein [Flavobacteriales bacterium]MBK9538864.1 tetratricopeptide repeat protein [Flavobacteriales bacterium]